MQGEAGLKKVMLCLRDAPEAIKICPLVNDELKSPPTSFQTVVTCDRSAPARCSIRFCAIFSVTPTMT